MFDVNFWS